MSIAKADQSAGPNSTSNVDADHGTSHASATGLKAARARDLTEHMEEAFAQLEHVPLREVLMESVYAERSSLDAIRSSFEKFTTRAHDLEKRRRFFASWQRTNNSAMSVEGLANRMTAEGEKSI